VSVAERIEIFGEVLQERGRRQDVLRSIVNVCLNAFRRNIYFEDPVLTRNDRMLSKKKLVIAGGFLAGLQDIFISSEIETRQL